MIYKNSKLSMLINLSTAVLLIVFSFTIFLSGSNKNPLSAESKKDVYTVCNDDEYYSETTYFLSETAYNSHLKESRLLNQSKSTVSNSINAISDISTNDEFVIAANKRVWVSEIEDNNGEIIESRLLSKHEVDRLNNNPISFSDDGFNVLYSGASVDPPVIYPPEPSIKFVGSDSESMHYLDIKISVYIHADNNYHITGTASWADKLVWAWETEKAAEENYLDYLGLTWGGENLLGDNQSISGKYYNNEDVNFSRKISDFYAGYVWQFNEKSGWLGKEMQKATAEVTLIKQGAIKNNYTCAKLTYIHTFGKVNGTVTLSANSNPAIAASVNISEDEKSWQVEVSIGNILF